MLQHLFIIPVFVVAIPIARVAMSIHNLMKKEVKQLVVDADAMVVQSHQLVIDLEKMIAQLQNTIANLDSVLKQSDTLLLETSSAMPQTLSHVSLILSNKIPETIKVLDTLLHSTHHVMTELDIRNLVYVPASIRRQMGAHHVCLRARRVRKVCDMAHAICFINSQMA